MSTRQLQQAAESSLSPSNFTSSFLFLTQPTLVAGSCPNQAMELYKLYKALAPLFGNDLEQLASTKFRSECVDYVDACDFKGARECIENDEIAWRCFVVYLPLASLLVFIALLFNGLSIAMTAKVRHKLPRHLLLQNLSISDSTLSVLTIFKRAIDFLPEQRDFAFVHPQLVIYGNMFWQATWLVSAFCLLLLAIDCVIATTFPFVYTKSQSRVTAAIVLTCLWTGSLTFAVLLFIFDAIFSTIVQNIVCLLMLVILMVVVAVCFYTFFLAEKMRRQMETLQTVDQNNRRKSNVWRKSRVKSSVTVALIMVSSFVSWLPLVIYFSVVDDTVHTENLELSHRFLIVCLICFHVNAVANPVVYSLRFKDVRGQLRKLCLKYRILKPFASLLGDPDEETQGTSISPSSMWRNSAPDQHVRASMMRDSKQQEIPLATSSDVNNQTASLQVPLTASEASDVNNQTTPLPDAEQN